MLREEDDNENPWITKVGRGSVICRVAWTECDTCVLHMGNQQWDAIESIFNQIAGTCQVNQVIFTDRLSDPPNGGCSSAPKLRAIGIALTTQGTQPEWQRPVTTKTKVEYSIQIYFGTQN